MIRREHQAGGTVSMALYSRCGGYRYGLSRRWGAGDELLFVMLNPSTATEAADDPTVARCVRRARRLGFGAVAVANIFALRATDPKALYRAADPVGPDNDTALGAAAQRADRILCAWGGHGALHGRGAAVAARLAAGGRPLWHLGLTRAGHPKHPLYIGQDRRPEPWDQAAISGLTST